MAQRPSSGSSKQQTAKRGQTAARKGRNPRAAQAAQAQAKPKNRTIIDDYVKRDIIGVSIIVLAVALLIGAMWPGDAIVSSFVSNAMHGLFGLGAYILPVFLGAYGASFLLKTDQQHISGRLAIGFVLILVALLGIFATFTPNPGTEGFMYLFDPTALNSLGGYVGSGLAFAGMNLFGQIITVLILLGVIIIGLAIIGLSITKWLEAYREARGEFGDEDEFSAPPFARIKRGGKPVDYDELGDDPALGVLNAPDDESKPQSILLGAKRALSGEGNATRKLARKGEAIASDFADDHEPQNTVALSGRRRSASDAVAQAGTETPLTRKLGKKNAKDEPAKKEAKASAPASKASKRPQTPLAAPKAQEGFELPDMDILAITHNDQEGLASEDELRETGMLLQETLGDFGVMAEVVGWVAGPTVTLFKVDLPSGVRVSRVTGLTDDIALALAAPGVRIFAPIPGTNYVGIEVPNKTRQTVYLGDVLKDAKPGPLQIAIGKDVEGHTIVSDLAKMPHLLIGGTTGSGKSVSINAMIMSILMRATPSEVRFIMIDPKRVEFTPYNGIPHLYVPVVTEPKEAAGALSWGVAEMERRLKVFSKVGARNIGQYNAKVQSGALEEENATEMPYIVIIIDELADLMMNVGKEVEFSISRIAQLARAAGIHLIVATQRPSTNVVTGLIKANITNRIAFNVASGIDSRVILDTPGAENLIGLGDLLLSKPEFAKPQRIQGCFVSEDEIFTVVEHLKSQGEPDYHNEILQTNLITLGASQPDGSGGSCGDDDPLIWEAAEIVVSSKLGSTSNIQRRLKVGYSRAGRIMDMLEEKGVVGPPNGSKPREVLVDEMELETLKAFESQDGAGE